MMPANYQHAKSEEINIINNDDETIALKIVAGIQKEKYGVVKTQTEVNVFTVKTEETGSMEIDLPQHHQSLIYLLDGEVLVNNELILKKGAIQMLTFNQDGNSVKIEAKQKSNFLVLSGEPIKEKIVQYGPYVMNTQTEIMEAMRDYQQGKMGYLY